MIITNNRKQNKKYVNTCKTHMHVYILICKIHVRYIKRRHVNFTFLLRQVINLVAIRKKY